MTTATSELLSTSDCARLLGLAADTVRLMDRDGRLPASMKTQRGTRIYRREDVEAFAQRRREKAAVGGG